MVKAVKIFISGDHSWTLSQKPRLPWLDLAPILIGLQSWEKLISSKCCAILKHRFTWWKTCMWLALWGCVTWWPHVHFGERTGNFNVSKIPVPPKSSYPLAQRSQSFGRNHITSKGSSLNMNPLEAKVELMSNGKYERRGSSTTISLVGRKQCLRNSILSVVQTTITKFRCSEHDTEGWHSQAALTEAFKISSFPNLSPPLVTQIFSTLPLHECSRAIVSQETNTSTC